ncbi:MAG: hypothetical protein ABUL77_01695 [Bacteroidota bacterium]
MIAYEELQKALARWKNRRSGGAESPAPALEAASPYYQNRDSTGEIDLADAEVTDAGEDTQGA